MVPGRDLNYHTPLTVRELLISQSGKNVRIAHSAESGYTAGTQSSLTIGEQAGKSHSSVRSPAAWGRPESFAVLGPVPLSASSGWNAVPSAQFVFDRFKSLPSRDGALSPRRRSFLDGDSP